MTAPRYLSHSQLSTLRDCGEQYRLRYTERLERQPMTAAVGGTIIHAVSETIDQHLLQGVNDAPTLKDAASAEAQLVLDRELAYVAEHSPSFTDPSTWLSFGKSGYQNLSFYMLEAVPAAIDNFIAWRAKTPNLVPLHIPNFGPAIEWPFVVAYMGRELRGVIDRIYQDVNTGVCVIVDIKSGAKPKNLSQLGRYGYAVRAQDNPVLSKVRWGSYLYNLRRPSGDRVKPTYMSPVDLNWWTDQRLERYDSAAISMVEQGLFVPNPGEACFMCTLKHHCDFIEASL